MTVATAESCADAFLAQWVSRFGLPVTAQSDNGNTFLAQLWQRLFETLGILVTYSPVYRPASLGGLERQHRDIKSGLKTTLLKMGDSFGSQWLRALPWVLLSRRTAFQPELGTCSAELVMGQTPRVPGDIAGADLSPDSDLPALLSRLRSNAQRSPVQTAHHGTKPVYWPESVKTASHVYTRRGKVTPLGHNFDGPFRITERIGNSSLKVKVGEFTTGKDRIELHHWANCKPAAFLDTPVEAQRPIVGRKAKDARCDN